MHDQEKQELWSSLEGLRCEKEPASSVGFLTLDRPPLNVVSFKARAQISSLLEEMDRDDDIRVIVIRGANGVFSAGGDIAEFLQIEPGGMADLAWNMAAPERCRKPVIAALEKYAMGMALELALACDFRIAVKRAKIGLPETTLGLIPGWGGTKRASRLLGPTRARRLIFGGGVLSADDALQIGLIDEVVSDAADLGPAIERLFESMHRGGPRAIAMVKRALATGDEPAAFAECFAGSESGEGISAIEGRGASVGTTVGGGGISRSAKSGRSSVGASVSARIGISGTSMVTSGIERSIGSTSLEACGASSAGPWLGTTGAVDSRASKSAPSISSTSVTASAAESRSAKTSVPNSARARNPRCIAPEMVAPVFISTGRMSAVLAGPPASYYVPGRADPSPARYSGSRRR